MMTGTSWVLNAIHLHLWPVHKELCDDIDAATSEATFVSAVLTALDKIDELGFDTKDLRVAVDNFESYD